MRRQCESCCVCTIPKLLFGAAFLLASAQAQINFFLATEEACNEFNFPCQGGILCCPRPALCIPYFNQLVCLDIGGSSVDGGTGGIDVNGLLGDILGGDATSLPSIISGGEVGPVVLPTIPSDGSDFAFTPSISGGGVGPIVIPTLIDGGGITLTPSFPGGEVTPIVIPTPPPVRSGGDDGALAGEQTTTSLPPPTTTKSPITSAPLMLSSTIPTGGRTSGDDSGFVTSRTPSSAISISILPSFTSVAKGEGGGETIGGENTGGENTGGENTGGETAGENTAGGEIAGENTAGGDTTGGDTTGEVTAGGDTVGGNTAGGDAAGGNTAGGETGKPTGGATTGGKTAGGETGKPGGGETATPTDGGSTSSGSASGPGPTATGTETNSFTGAASPRSVRCSRAWGSDSAFVIALGVTIAGMSTIMVG